MLPPTPLRAPFRANPPHADMRRALLPLLPVLLASALLSTASAAQDTSETAPSETAASETAARPVGSETAASETAASETAASETAASETAARPAGSEAPTGLEFLAGVQENTPKTPEMSAVLRNQIGNAGFDVKSATGDGCLLQTCLQKIGAEQQVRYLVLGAVTRGEAFDVYEVVIYDTVSKKVVGRVFERGRGETAFIQKMGEFTTRLLASATLDKKSRAMVVLDLYKVGIPAVDPVERSDFGRSFPVLSLAGFTVGGTGLALLGVGILFGVTSNANHNSALTALNQVDAALLLDQRDVNSFFANGLFVVGGALFIGGATAIGLGYAWGE